MCVEGAINRSALSPSHQRLILQELAWLQRSFDLQSWKLSSPLSCSELEQAVYQLSCFHVEIKAGQWPLSVPRTASSKHVCMLGVSWEQYWIPAILVKAPQAEPRLHFHNNSFSLSFNLPVKCSDRYVSRNVLQRPAGMDNQIQKDSAENTN